MAPVVVVRPMSGYANRLQAIVSSAVLAEDLGAELLVCWTESEVAPVPASAVLDSAWCTSHVRTPAEITERCGIDPTAIEHHLSVDTRNRTVTLAGMALGEQHFMPSLREAIADVNDVRALVISAGGKFTLDGDAALTAAQARRFRARRFEAYAALPLNAEIEQRAATAGGARPFVGLHLRYSDRSAETPWEREIAPAVRHVAAASAATSVFVASDSALKRQNWEVRLASMGLEPWSADPGDFPRDDPRSAVGALVDWRILTRSEAMVYFAASSFAEEAAVASGAFDTSIGLTGSRTRTAWVRAGQYIDAARAYPRRHGWWGLAKEGP